MKIDKEFLRNRLCEARDLADSLDYDLGVAFAKKVMELKESNNKIIFIGNGASTTIANHASLDYMSQTGVQTICINDPAVITAFSNDFGYDDVFARFMKINFKEGDMLVSVSSSGNSPNVVNAVKYVESIGGLTYSFSGFDKDNQLMQNSKNNFWVDSDKYNVVETTHNLWLAMICDLLIEWMGEDVGLHGLEL